MSPTPLTAYLLAGVALSGFLLPAPLVVGAALVVAAFAAVDSWVSRRHPVVTRNLAEVVSRGVPSAVRITLEGPAAGRARVRQPVPPDLVVDPSEAAGGLSAELVALRRGAHTIPAPVVRVVGPLRLGRSTRAAGEEHEVSVYPDLPAARRLASTVRRGLFRTEGQRSRGPLGLGTEFETLRDYVDGDDIRQVNWLATARYERPMVNEFRIEQDRDVICVVDAGRLMAAPIGTMTRMDAAVDAVAAVAAVTQVVGDRIGVVAFDEAITIDLPSRRRGAEAAARAIFDLEPSPVDSDYRRVFEHVAGMKRSFVLVLTDLLDPAAARPLVEATPILARRHAVAVAGVLDPDVTEAITSVPRDLVDAARAAVAADVLAARRRVVGSLEHHGAAVIERPPGELSAACVAAYLRAKSAVRI